MAVFSEGKILFDKVTVQSGSSESFDFSLSGGPNAINQPFSLTDAATLYDRGKIEAGSYTVVEGSELWWTLENIVLNGDLDSSSTIDLVTRTVTIDVDPGEIITVTFKN